MEQLNCNCHLGVHTTVRLKLNSRLKRNWGPAEYAVVMKCNVSRKLVLMGSCMIESSLFFTWWFNQQKIALHSCMNYEKMNIESLSIDKLFSYNKLQHLFFDINDITTIMKSMIQIMKSMIWTHRQLKLIMLLMGNNWQRTALNRKSIFILKDILKYDKS